MSMLSSFRSKPKDPVIPPKPEDDELPELTDKNSRKLRPTHSTHFGDVDFEEEEMGEIADATWAEVGRACCVHSSMEWGKIFIGVCAALFFLYFFSIRRLPPLALRAVQRERDQLVPFSA